MRNPGQNKNKRIKKFKERRNDRAEKRDFRLGSGDRPHRPGGHGHGGGQGHNDRPFKRFDREDNRPQWDEREVLELLGGVEKLRKVAMESQLKIRGLVAQAEKLRKKRNEDAIQNPDAKKFSERKSLHMDIWQQRAYEIMMEGENLIVDAPTSAGKTRCIEAFLDSQLNKGVRLIYTAPVKSLSNDKYRDFCERYGHDKVGINTGDFKENLNAPIVVATLETYRNSLLGLEPNMRRMVVVYDEYHYLQDESRGSAWEESIILTPKDSQLVLLSASVPNTDAFAEWITLMKQKPCRVIQVQERPVPLEDVIFVNGIGWMLERDLKIPASSVEILKKKYQEIEMRRSRRFEIKEKYMALMDPIKQALELGLGPCVVYAARRADVEALAVVVGKEVSRAFRDASDLEPLRKRVKELPGWEFVPRDVQNQIFNTGVAYHHSGMIPPGRVAIESLLKEGLLRVCCGTMGISLGVNFAVRSALISDQTRPGDGGDMPYSNSEVLQMLGRAGRRGIDQQGFSLWPHAGKFAFMRPRARENCQSSLKFDPTTVLGLLGQQKNLAYLSEFYRKSFFMRGKNQDQVNLLDHDLLTAELYSKHKVNEVPCNDIPETYSHYRNAKNRNQVQCHACPAISKCHPLVEKVSSSTLQGILDHLKKIHAIKGAELTRYGHIARCFPQSGGMIIAHWISQGDLNAETFLNYIGPMAAFCGAHHKDIPVVYADLNYLKSLHMPKLIENYYPEALFKELYDEDFERGSKFREFHYGAASVVTGWLIPGMKWNQLIDAHESKKFSAGDCMMILFRFATLLQSCMRLFEQDKDLARVAQETYKQLMREPLDVRNKMLMEEIQKELAKKEKTESKEKVEPQSANEL